MSFEDMKKNNVLAMAITAILLLSACKTTHTVTDSTMHAHTSEEGDTLRVEETTYWRDTTHLEIRDHHTTHVVEYYDPATGKLQQRVIDDERDLHAALAELRDLRAWRDSIQASQHKDSDTASELHEEKEKEGSSSLLWPCLTLLSLALSLVGVVRRLATFGFGK